MARLKTNPKEKVKNIKAVVFDGDGVFFTPQDFISESGESMKVRSFVDGQGISLLRAVGLKITFVTAEKTKFLESVVTKLNNLPSVTNGKWAPITLFAGPIASDKVVCINEWLAKNQIEWEECAYMGDDVGDFQIMKKVGLPTCPAQAEKIIKGISLFIAPREGGNGAIRDLCNFILESKNIDPASLSLR
jgi:3-deoxy-D-manno-octulosonate 8-phosphate phosphatase (KDO 8-P phosphatase)